jgi:hypothetical protein
MNAPHYTRITARKKFGNNNNNEMRRVAKRSGALLAVLGNQAFGVRN